MRNHELVDDRWLASRYGVIGAQYVDYATLRGDSSDGLPGAAGIGEKTAAGLLAQYGDLHGILEAAGDSSSGLGATVRSRLLSARDYLLRAEAVVRCVDDLALGGLDLSVQAIHPTADIADLAERWAVRGPMSRLLTALGQVFEVD